MKPKFFNTFVFLLLLFSGFKLHAQDKLIKKDGSVLEVIIKEITDKQIKYVDYKDPDGILFTIDRALVKEVNFQYGKTMEVKNPHNDPWYFADDKINNFMLNFGAIGGNTLGISYERAIKPGQSVLGELKLYGLGIKNEDEISRTGVGFDVYYRLKLGSVFSKKEYRPNHILQGTYFAPNIGFSTGTYTYTDFWYINYDEMDNVSVTNKHTVMDFGISCGYQWIIQNTLSVDASVGFHYYVGNQESSIDNDYFYDDFLRLGNMWGGSNRLASFNLRIGFLTGKARIVKKQ